MRSNGLLPSLTASLILAAAAAPASAVVIAEYGFPEVVLAPGTFDPTSSDTELSTLAGPASEAGDVDIASFGGSDYRAFIRADNGTVESAALALGTADYLSFEITGSGFDITEISFDYALSTTSSNGFYGTALYGSFDDFTSSFLLGSQLLQGTGSSIAQQNYAIDTTGVSQLDGLIASEIEIRFYFFDYTFNTETEEIGVLNLNQVHSVDNIVVEGTPEPSSLIVLGLCGTGLLLHRRRV